MSCLGFQEVIGLNGINEELTLTSNQLYTDLNNNILINSNINSNFTIYSCNQLSNLIQPQLDERSNLIYIDSNLNTIIHLTAQNVYYPIYGEQKEIRFHTAENEYITKINQEGGLEVYHPLRAIPVPIDYPAAWWNVEEKLTFLIQDGIGLRFDITNLQAGSGIGTITNEAEATAAAVASGAGLIGLGGVTGAAATTIAGGDYGSVALGIAGGALFSVLGYLSYQAQVGCNLSNLGFSNQFSNVNSNMSNANLLLTSNLYSISRAQGFINCNILSQQYINSLRTNELRIGNTNISNIFVSSNVANQQLIQKIKTNEISLNFKTINKFSLDALEDWIRTPNGIYYDITNGNLGVSATPNINDFLIVGGQTTIQGDLITETKMKITNTNNASPQSGINGGIGDKIIIKTGTSTTYPYSIGIENKALWISGEDNINFYNRGIKSLSLTSNNSTQIFGELLCNSNLKLNNTNISNIFVASNVASNTSNTIYFNYNNLNSNTSNTIHFNYSNLNFNTSNFLNSNTSNLILEKFYTDNRKYPPKLFTSSSSQSSITYLYQNPIYFETINLNTIDISYGNGTYEIYSSENNTTSISLSGTGNTINNVVNDDNYSYALFNSNGTFTTNSNIICDILIVGGGGGGGSFGGGGGAGNVLYTTNFNLPSGTYSIVVGLGGAGSANNSSNASNGSNSSININGTNYIAIGGGGGGTRFGAGSGYIGRGGNNGGSGGGGSHSDSSTPNNVGGSSTKNSYSGWTSLGNSGGDGKDGTSGGYGSGGGGGAGSIGANGGTNSGGNGGSGVNLISIFGSSVGNSGWFGGGGGGASWTGSGGQVGYGNGGNGLLGGGGNAYSGNGLANTGGGAGGATEGQLGGTGGSGVVIIRYLKTSNQTKKELFNFEKNEVGSEYGSFNYNSSSGNYLSTDRYIKNDYYGDFLVVKLPTEIILNKYRIYSRPSFVERAPSLLRLYGSTNNIDWEQINDGSISTIALTLNDYSLGFYEKIVNNQIKSYSYFGIVVNKIIGGNPNANNLNFTEFELYGKEFVSYVPIYTSSNVLSNTSNSLFNNFFNNSNILSNVNLTSSNSLFNYSSNNSNFFSIQGFNSSNILYNYTSNNLFSNNSNIYATSNAVKSIVEFQMPLVSKHYAFYISITTPIVINSKTYYKYDVDLRQYTKLGYIDIGSQSGDSYRIFKLRACYGSMYFSTLVNGVPNVLYSDIFMSMKANSTGGLGVAGLNICSVGNINNPKLDTIPPNNLFFMRNGANSIDYITIVSTSPADVRCFVEDMIS